VVDAAVSALEEPTQQAALDRMTDGFFIMDGEWRITYANERAREIIRGAMGEQKRAEIDDLAGVRLWDAVPAAVDTPFYYGYHDAMETQEVTSFEEYYEPLETWFEVRVYPSRSGLSVYLRDVTDRKSYEQTLEHREGVLASMYRIVADKARSFEGKVDQLFAIGREELGTEYATLSRVDDEYVFEHVQTPDGDDTVERGDVVPLSWTTCERVVATEERLAIGDMASQTPGIAERAGNEEMGIQCYLGSPVIVDGEVYGTFCFYGTEPRREPFSRWEVTLVDLMGSWVSYECERRLREEELTRKRNRLEEFANVVSHDLRNPLNVALSRLELARDEHHSEHLDEVGDALDRMGRIVDDVLALARLGQQVVDEERIDFADLVRTTWASAGDDAAELVFESDAGTVLGDEDRLHRLFENLFRNAIEHGGSTVRVTVGDLAGGTGFWVADDGPGIPADERETVFERGYTTRAEGTGFGLAIVREVVEAHDGEITVTESADGGARFEVTGIDVRSGT
jgi:signal transduction histidine kinase